MMFFTILMLSILTGAEVDVFTPSFPELQATFNLSPFMVELMLSVNLIAHCVSSLIVGNLGDRYGRKNIIIIGLIIFIIGSLFCCIATSYWQILLGRVFQGVGIAGPAVLEFLVIADHYPLAEQQQKMGLLNGLTTLAMSIAPVFGSYISLWFKWQGNFTMLLIGGVICLALAIKFLPKSQANYNIKISIKEYFPIFKSKFAIYYIITICLLTQSYWIFIGMSPILYMENLHVPLKYFGFYQGALCLFFAITSLSSGYLLKRYGQKKCLLVGVGLLICFIFGTSILMAFNINKPMIITLILQLEAIGIVFPINILWPIALEAVPNAKGRMAAMMVAGRLVITSIGLQIVSYFYQGVFFHIGVAMVFSLVLALLVYSRLFKIENAVTDFEFSN